MRYLQALFITIIIFVISAFVIVSLFNTKDIKQKEFIIKVIPIIEQESRAKDIKKSTKIKKNYLKKTPVTIQKITPKVVKKVSKIKTKTKTKQIIKKASKIKLKKVKHKKISKKTIHKKSNLKKLKNKKYKTAKHKLKNIINQKSNYLISTQKSNFLSIVRAKIKTNLVYPKDARYHHTEGRVEVMFNILPSGRVENIRFIRAKRVFRKSILNAFNKVFPINIPTTIQSQAPFCDIYLPLNFKIKN